MIPLPPSTHFLVAFFMSPKAIRNVALFLSLSLLPVGVAHMPNVVVRSHVLTKDAAATVASAAANLSKF